jgi:fluoroacetyl-CoA thioesterase
VASDEYPGSDRAPGSDPDAAGVAPGLEGTAEATVTEDVTAASVGSGDVAVLATPEVLALVERAAVAAVRDRLGPDRTSVGSSVSLDHVAPTPVGGVVRATVRLERVEGRRLSFSFVVIDGAGRVAEGSHVRVVVDRRRFEASARDRLDGAGDS